MSKKLLTVIGILLLLAAFVFGIYTFIQRHENNELLKNPTPRSTLSTNKVLAFNKKRYLIDNPFSIWIVINKQRPLTPLKYVPQDLVNAGNNQLLRKEAAEALALLTGEAEKQGFIIAPLSGYRSYDTQVTIYSNEVKTYGQEVADTQSARPGYSEHQTGWAIDVGGGGCGIEDCFANTAEGKWVALHAYKYGFIVRYTAAKQNITGYRAEPWHIRYIGTELSQEMYKENITTLEEFFRL